MNTINLLKTIIVFFALIIALSSATQVQAQNFKVELRMPDLDLSPGDPFWLDALVMNPGQQATVNLLVILESNGVYWFYPSWQQGPPLDAESITLDHGWKRVRVLEEFEWPLVGTTSCMKFYGLVMDSTMTNVLSDVDELEWCFSSGFPGLEISSEAYLKTGPVSQGTWILPNGRKITPWGTLAEVDHLPLGMVVTPDDKYVITIQGGRGQRSITTVDLQTDDVTFHQETFFVGLDISRDGKTIYASGGGRNQISVYDFNAGVLRLREEWDGSGFLAGLALSHDEKHLYVVGQLTSMLHCFDVASGQLVSSIFTRNDPFTVVLNRFRQEAYVSAEGANAVDFFDISDPKDIKDLGSVEVQKNPEGMALSGDGSKLYVTNADEDSVSVIDTGNRIVLKTIDLRPYTAYGSSPNALCFGPSGDRLYVAQASTNRIAVLSLPSGDLVGAIPTCWYPTAVALSSNGDKIFIANGKGVGSGTSSLVNRGVVQIADMPGDQELAQGIQQVELNNSLPGRLFDITVTPEQWTNPIPLERGGPTPIKHVIFVVRENKTYDALLGDFEKGDGDKNLCLFCYDETPNLHALVEQFASGDNYYSNAEASIQGHEITTASIVNSYVEKLWAAPDRSLPIEADVYAKSITYPKMDFIFQNCLRHGVSFRDYGEAIGTGKDGLMFDTRYVHWGPMDPPIYNMFTRDVDKLTERIHEFEMGIFPQLIYMLFPNDHHWGCTFPYPTPRSMIADNDLATGQLIEWISNSRYWRDSIVFVIEDDPQQGRDHVDAHRSILLVASPWVRRGYVSKVHYSEANIHATIEYLLGMGPMSVYDEIAQPMYDLFTSEPDFSPFKSLPRIVPEEISLPGTTCAQASKGLNFNDPDEAEGLQELTYEYEMERRRLMMERQDLEETARAWPWNWVKVFKQLIAPKLSEKDTKSN